MDKNEFKKLKPGDRILSRANVWGTIGRVYQDSGHWLATVHFDGDPKSKTFTVWPEVVVQAEIGGRAQGGDHKEK